jgi:hypothetical protein
VVLSQHLSQEFAPEGEPVALDAVVGLEQPPARPQLDQMHAVAGRAAGDLGHQRHRVALQRGAQTGRGVDHVEEVGRVHAQRLALDLRERHVGAGEGRLQEDRKADKALGADRGDLDRRGIGRRDD